MRGWRLEAGMDIVGQADERAGEGDRQGSATRRTAGPGTSDALLAALHSTTFVVIDFEALTPAGRPAEPTEVAAVALTVREGRWAETGRFESLIQPPSDVPVTARDLAHGMPDAALRGQSIVGKSPKTVPTSCPRDDAHVDAGRSVGGSGHAAAL
ncbi:hypothetical protein [Streptomyces sp. NPDC048172]|uniref:hypothetical protein n=1 Tax=Streptomyces sp. NPDC048172 TaxID=3365505 RepID=UPI00371CAC34